MEPVLLRVYDISNGKVKRWAPWIIGKHHESIEGIWHTGLIAYGWEYFYGGCGIEKMRPDDVLKDLPMELTRTIDLGVTQMTQNEFERWVLSVQPYFGAKQYDLISWNCNSFTDCILRKLLPESGGLPDYISKLVTNIEKSTRGRAIIQILKSIGNLFDPARRVECDCENCRAESVQRERASAQIASEDLQLIEATKRQFSGVDASKEASVQNIPSSMSRSSWSWLGDGRMSGGGLIKFCSKIPDDQFSIDSSSDESDNEDRLQRELTRTNINKMPYMNSLRCSHVISSESSNANEELLINKNFSDSSIAYHSKYKRNLSPGYVSSQSQEHPLYRSNSPLTPSEWTAYKPGKTSISMSSNSSVSASCYNIVQDSLTCTISSTFSNLPNAQGKGYSSLIEGSNCRSRTFSKSSGSEEISPMGSLNRKDSFSLMGKAAVSSLGCSESRFSAMRSSPINLKHHNRMSSTQTRSLSRSPATVPMSIPNSNTYTTTTTSSGSTNSRIYTNTKLKLDHNYGNETYDGSIELKKYNKPGLSQSRISTTIMPSPLAVHVAPFETSPMNANKSLFMSHSSDAVPQQARMTESPLAKIAMYH